MAASVLCVHPRRLPRIFSGCAILQRRPRRLLIILWTVALIPVRPMALARPWASMGGARWVMVLE